MVLLKTQKVSEVDMNTNELVRRIDESIEMGKRVMAKQVGESSGRVEISDGVEKLFNKIKILFEKVYGHCNQLSGKFESIEGYNLNRHQYSRHAMLKL